MGDTINEKCARFLHLELPNNLRNIKRANTWSTIVWVFIKRVFNKGFLLKY